MQSFDDRSHSMFNPISSQETDQVVPSTEPLTQNESLTPLPFASENINVSPVAQLPFPPMVTDPFTPPPVSNVTRVLTRTLAEAGDTTSHRTPVIIRGNIKRTTRSSQIPHHERRKVTSLIGILVLFLLVSFSLLATTPLGHTVGLSFNSPSLSSNMEIANNQNSSNTINSIVAPATATAVYTKQQADGFDPYANGSMTVASGNSSLAWPYGQCTYWANYEYHALSGWYVAWSGNADQWVAGAGAAGWNVSMSPHVPSIIVLMPGVQLASSIFGHVAVVTSIINSTTVLSSNMNWYAQGGGMALSPMLISPMGLVPASTLSGIPDQRSEMPVPLISCNARTRL